MKQIRMWSRLFFLLSSSMDREHQQWGQLRVVLAGRGSQDTGRICSLWVKSLTMWAQLYGNWPEDNIMLIISNWIKCTYPYGVIGRTVAIREYTPCKAGKWGCSKNERYKVPGLAIARGIQPYMEYDYEWYWCCSWGEAELGNRTRWLSWRSLTICLNLWTYIQGPAKK